MPTLLRWKGYRFFFYSADGWEPAHIHVTKDRNEAKIWLENVTLAVNIGFSAKELNELIKKTRDEREPFLKVWHDHFAN
jgi:hypothetical protein